MRGLRLGPRASQVPNQPLQVHSYQGKLLLLESSMSGNGRTKRRRNALKRTRDPHRREKSAPVQLLCAGDRCRLSSALKPHTGSEGVPWTSCSNPVAGTGTEGWLPDFLESPVRGPCRERGRAVAWAGGGRGEVLVRFQKTRRSGQSEQRALFRRFVTRRIICDDKTHPSQPSHKDVLGSTDALIVVGEGGRARPGVPWCVE